MCCDYTTIANQYLIEASKSNDTWSINKLLTHTHADINFHGPQKMTPLHYAVDNDNINTTSLLIEKGADVNALNMLGLIPLHLTGKNHDTQISEFLINNGADVNHNICAYQISPLHQATKDNNSELVKLLIDHGANLEALNAFDYTPLMVAIQEDNAVMVQCLTSNGASISDNLYGKTPLALAAGKEKLQALEALIEFGADLNHKNGADKTALEIAFIVGKIGAVNMLIMHGADVPKAIQAKLDLLKPVDLDQVLPEDFLITPAHQDSDNHSEVTHTSFSNETQIVVYTPVMAIGVELAAPDQNENYF